MISRMPNCTDCVSRYFAVLLKLTERFSRCGVPIWYGPAKARDRSTRRRIVSVSNLLFCLRRALRHLLPDCMLPSVPRSPMPGWPRVVIQHHGKIRLIAGGVRQICRNHGKSTVPPFLRQVPGPQSLSLSEDTVSIHPVDTKVLLRRWRNVSTASVF